MNAQQALDLLSPIPKEDFITYKIDGTPVLQYINIEQ